jgi:hypothetical protein
LSRLQTHSAWWCISVRSGLRSYVSRTPLSWFICRSSCHELIRLVENTYNIYIFK